MAGYDGIEQNVDKLVEQVNAMQESMEGVEEVGAKVHEMDENLQEQYYYYYYIWCNMRWTRTSRNSTILCFRHTHTAHMVYIWCNMRWEDFREYLSQP